MNGNTLGTATLATGLSSDQQAAVGSFVNSFFTDGNIQEVIYYSADKSTVRTDIEGNISAYYQSAKLLDESYGSGAEAAYSVRQLKRDNTECMVIRRASDSTTTTIGFDSEGNISEADIISFCTGSDVYSPSVWHDQSQTGGTGSGNDATQSDPTKQPTIYTGGALVKENGKLALDFDGVSNTLVNTTVSVADYGFTLVNLNTYPSTSGIPSGLYDNTATSIYYHNNQVGGTGGFNNRIQARNSSTGQTWVQSVDGKNTLSYLSFDSSTTRTITADGNLNSTNNSNITFAAPNSFSIGAMSDSSPAGYINSNIQEVLLLNDIKNASDQTSIEENVGDYFTQNNATTRHVFRCGGGVLFEAFGLERIRWFSNPRP